MSLKTKWRNLKVHGYLVKWISWAIVIWRVGWIVFGIIAVKQIVNLFLDK